MVAPIERQSRARSWSIPDASVAERRSGISGLPHRVVVIGRRRNSCIRQSDSADNRVSAPCGLAGTSEPGRVAVGSSVGNLRSRDFNGHQFGDH